jgi:hypothetical protein
MWETRGKYYCILRTVRTQVTTVASLCKFFIRFWTGQKFNKELSEWVYPIYQAARCHVSIVIVKLPRNNKQIINIYCLELQWGVWH